MRRALGAALGALAVGVLAVVGASSAGAQVPPLSTTTTTTAPPEGEPPPEEPGDLTPVFEVLGPVVWPLCQDAVAVLLTFPEVPAVSSEDAPIFVLCGMVTDPDGRQTCAVDATAQLLIAQAAGPVLGATPAPVPAQEPVAAAAGLLVEVHDTAPPPPAPLPADPVDVAVASLGCLPANPADPSLPPVPPTAGLPAGPGADPLGLGTPAPAPALALRLPPLVPATSPAPAAASASPISASPPSLTRLLTGPRFAYPVVFAVPLLLLAAGSYLGRTLTRPIVVPIRSDEHR